MRVLVCGSRDFFDETLLARELSRLHAVTPFSVVIEGEANGADKLSAKWAVDNHIPVLPFPARWEAHGRAAGPIRNRVMLKEGKPDFVIAFSFNIAASKGTKNMLAQARQAGIPTLLFGSQP